MAASYVMRSENTPASRIVGIQLWADDFLGKPCNGDELVARIAAQRRRRGAATAR